MHIKEFCGRNALWMFATAFYLAFFVSISYGIWLTGRGVFSALSLAGVLMGMATIFALLFLVSIFGLISAFWLIQTLKTFGKPGVNKERFVIFLKEMRLLR